MIRPLQPLTARDTSLILRLTGMEPEDVQHTLVSLYGDAPDPDLPPPTRTQIRELILARVPSVLSPSALQVLVEAILALEIDTPATHTHSHTSIHQTPTRARIDAVLAPIRPSHLAAPSPMLDLILTTLHTSPSDLDALPATLADLGAVLNTIVEYGGEPSILALEEAGPAISALSAQLRIDTIMARLSSASPTPGHLCHKDADALASALGATPDPSDPSLHSLAIVRDSLLALLDWESDPSSILSSIEHLLGIIVDSDDPPVV